MNEVVSHVESLKIGHLKGAGHADCRWRKHSRQKEQQVQRPAE